MTPDVVLEAVRRELAKLLAERATLDHKISELQAFLKSAEPQ